MLFVLSTLPPKLPCKNSCGAETRLAVLETVGIQLANVLACETLFIISLPRTIANARTRINERGTLATSTNHHRGDAPP